MQVYNNCRMTGFRGNHSNQPGFALQGIAGLRHVGQVPFMRKDRTGSHNVCDQRSHVKHLTAAQSLPSSIVDATFSMLRVTKSCFALREAGESTRVVSSGLECAVRIATTDPPSKYVTDYACQVSVTVNQQRCLLTTAIAAETIKKPHSWRRSEGFHARTTQWQVEAYAAHAAPRAQADGANRSFLANLDL